MASVWPSSETSQSPCSPENIEIGSAVGALIAGRGGTLRETMGRGSLQEEFRISRTQRAGFAGVMGVVRLVIAGVVGLVVTRYTQMTLGKEDYGVWLMLVQISTYLVVADIFPTSLLKFELAHLKGTSKAMDKQSLIGYGICSVLISIPIYLVGLGFSLIWSQELIRSSSERFNWSSSTLVILGIVALLSKFVSVPEFALIGENLDYKTTAWRIGAVILVGLLDVVVVAMGFGAIGLAAARLIASAIELFVIVVLAGRNIPWFELKIPEWSGYWSFWKKGRPLFVLQLGNALADSVDIVLIGYLAGSSAATVYVISGTLMRLIGQIGPVGLSGILPGFGDLLGRQRHQEAEMVRQEAEVLLIFLWGVAATVVLGVNELFVRNWAGLDRFGGRSLTVFIILLGLLQQHNLLQMSLLLFGLDIQRTSWTKCATSLLGLFLAALLGIYFDIWGCLLGLLIGRIAFCASSAIRLNFILGTSNSGYLSVLSRPLFIGFIVIACVGLPIELMASGGVIGLILWAGIAGICAVLLLWLVGLNAVQRATIIRRLQLLLVR